MAVIGQPAPPSRVAILERSGTAGARYAPDPMAGTVGGSAGRDTGGRAAGGGASRCPGDSAAAVAALGAVARLSVVGEPSRHRPCLFSDRVRTCIPPPPGATHVGVLRDACGTGRSLASAR